MSDKTIFTQFSIEELALEVARVLAPSLTKTEVKATPSGEGELLTRKEVAQFLKISLKTLDHWTRQGDICAYRIRNRVLYKHSDVKGALTIMRTGNDKGNHK